MMVDWGRRGLVAGAVVAALLWLGAGPAAAHNQLIGSDPPNGETLAEGPAEVRLSFLASLDPENTEVTVTAPDGASVIAGELTFDGGEVSVPVRTTVAGDYEVTYHVLSADGDWVDGTLTFTVTTGTQAAESQESPTPAPSPSPSPSPSPEAAAAAVPQPAATTEDESSGLSWWMWLLIAVVLAAGGYGSYQLSRRRSRQ